MEKEQTWEDLFEIATRHKEELDAISEIEAIDYCMHPALNIPALKILSKYPPSKSLSKKVQKILENVPCVWFPDL